MQVKELMSETVICVTPETSLQEAARYMNERDIGSLPVVESTENKKLIGMLTDRDITCRIVAQGKNPLDLTVQEAMSTGPVFNVRPETSEDDLCKAMEEHQIRRMPVVDGQDVCCGIVSQADIAQRGSSEHETAEIVQYISRPTPSSRAE